MNRRNLTQKIFLTTFMFFLLLTLARRTQAAPSVATPLIEGRTYDQAHDWGKIDWSGSILYENFYHRDGSSLPPSEGGASCGGGCWENVTKINNGATVSGSFERDVTYFEAMAAYEYQGTGVGSVVITACSSSLTVNLRYAKNSAAGFNSLILAVPPGCRAWTVRAIGGHVHFRSVDVFYVAPTATPSPTRTSAPTRTPTFTPTQTNAPTNTAAYTPTGALTFTPTATYTPTNTATSTAMPTFTAGPTATSAVAFTPTNTPTETYTPTPTYTFTPTSTVAAMATNPFAPKPTFTPAATAPNTPRPNWTPANLPRIARTSTATFTATATQTQSPTATMRPTQAATNTPTARPAAVPTALQEPPSAPKTQRKRLSVIWMAFLGAGLLIVFATNSLMDPRPAALTRMGEIIDRLSQN